MHKALICTRDPKCEDCECDGEYNYVYGNEKRALCNCPCHNKLREYYTQFSERLLVQHFGDDHHSGHIETSSFDYYCVAAHGEDFSPKYLNGEICHDGMEDGLCHPNCHQCGPWSACPIEPCPITYDDDE